MNDFVIPEELLRRKCGGRRGQLSRAEYQELVTAAKERGRRGRLVRGGQGDTASQLIDVMVVSADEVRHNPAFAALRDREGAYRRLSSSTSSFASSSSTPYRRKQSNCLSEASLDTDKNNSSVHSKKSKKGFVKDIMSNNINSVQTEKSLKERLTEFFKKRESYSLYIFDEDSQSRKFCAFVTSQDWFDFIILTFIAANCITLAMERPTIPPW